MSDLKRRTRRMPQSVPVPGPVSESSHRASEQRTVAEIVRVDWGSRVPGTDAAVYALAVAAGFGDERTRRAALAALPEVCRTGAHIVRFAQLVETFDGHRDSSNAFSIADLNDPDMLAGVGFDTASPQLVSDFVRRAL